MQVEVDQAHARVLGQVAGKHPQLDRAVPAEHQQRAVAEGGLHALRGVAGDRGNGVQVLRARSLAVGAPAPHGRVADVAHLHAALAQGGQQPRFAQRRWSALLARREGAGAGGDSEDGKGGHESNLPGHDTD